MWVLKLAEGPSTVFNSFCDGTWISLSSSGGEGRGEEALRSMAVLASARHLHSVRFHFREQRGSAQETRPAPLAEIFND